MVGSLKDPISLKELITVIDNNAYLDLILITGCSLGCVTVETNLKGIGEVIILKAHNFLKSKTTPRQDRLCLPKLYRTGSL